MKFNLTSDRGGRAFGKALHRAYWLGYNDAVKLHNRKSKIRALRTADELAKEICSRCWDEQKPHLRSAYGAGLLAARLDLE